MSELAAVIKMVDEVVKPLLAIQKSLEKTQKDFHKTQADILQASYQLTALYECFDQNNKMIAERSADLETLGEHFNVSFTELRDIQKKIDSSIKNGIKGAAGHLINEVQEQVQTYLASEVESEVKYLQEAIKDTHTKLSDYESMTWGMHVKIVVVSILCGVSIGAVTFFSFSHKIKHVSCECECSVPVCPVVPAEPPPPPKPREPIKKAQPVQPFQRQRYR